MASGNNDDIQNLNAFLGGWSAAVARMAIPSDATLRGSSQGASAVDFQHAACYRAARRLLGILPPEAIAFPLGIDVSQLTRHGVAPTLTIHLRLAATFAPDTALSAIIHGYATKQSLAAIANCISILLAMNARYRSVGRMGRVEG
ncbi:hypothetical protein RI054_11g55850 [Pseudoscourfieldia marina]